MTADGDTWSLLFADFMFISVFPWFFSNDIFSATSLLFFCQLSGIFPFDVTWWYIFCSHFDWFGSVWRIFFSTLMNLVRNIFIRLLLWTTRMLIQIVIVPFFSIVPCLLLQCIRVVNAFHGYSLDGSENQYIHNINHLFRRVYTFNMNMHCRWMDGTSEIRTNA